MRHRAISSLSIATVVVALWSQGCVSVTVTTDSLLNEMTDLRRLSELPSPAYATRQFSSYDPKSKTPDDHEGWFANNDRGHYLRVEKRGDREEHVMMDADGPGAIVRIWSANPKGVLRIYVDGSDVPVIESPMGDLLCGKVAAFPEPIAGMRARGTNLYFPIPYAKHCKVTSDEGGFYYLVNYRTYGPGTLVKSFEKQDLPQLANKIRQVARQLKQPYGAEDLPADAEPRLFDAAVAAGAQGSLAEISGSGAVCALLVQVEAEDMEAAARSLVLSMSFDGEQTVQCPIGDFFGTAPGLTPYESLPMGISDEKKQVLWCHWLMPFRRSARITVRNLGKQQARVNGMLGLAPYRWTDRSLLFHAKWRIERKIPTRPFTDWPHLECEGHGRFVGGALHVANPVKNWWGEGDEKIYVDGEKFPSHFGTGTEDYYGYAWCCNERFVHAYHNQPRCDGPRNFGHTSVNRFHVIDDIPFTRQFKFDIENWHSHASTATTRAAVSYWYARPGGSDFFKPITAADVAPPQKLEFKVRHVPGAIEGEKMQELTVPGNCRIENLGQAFSGEEHLWWEKAKPGDKLVLGFNVTEAGQKYVIVRLTRNNDYAKVQLYVNDRKAGDVIDLYNESVQPADELDLGAFDLEKGQNRLTVEIVGANEKAIKNYEFAVDYIKLK